MTDQLYIRPIALAESPQSEEGAAIRLGGGMVYASRFAVITREAAEELGLKAGMSASAVVKATSVEVRL